MYIQILEYQTKTLRSEFRQSKFSLHDFLNYSGKTSNHCQLMRLKEFFNFLSINLVVFFQIFIVIYIVLVYNII